MVCPYCSHDSQVTNSRHQKRANSVWRRRKCLGCSAIWTTSEAPQAPTIYRVSKDQHMVVFRPETLLISLYESLRHKKTADIDAKYVFDTVMNKLQAKHLAVIPTQLIAKTAHDVLRRYNKPASAVYKAQHPY
jgi:transcriptional repressor NrdR